MSLEENFNQFARNVERDLGRIIASQENLNSHIGAVSKKADAIRIELDDHKENNGAHGIEATTKGHDSMGNWISLIISAIALFLAFSKR